MQTKEKYLIEYNEKLFFTGKLKVLKKYVSKLKNKYPEAEITISKPKKIKNFILKN